jgi:hypothetical protein
MSSIHDSTPETAVPPVTNDNIHEPVAITLFRGGEKSKGVRKETTWARLFTAFHSVKSSICTEKNSLGGWCAATFKEDHRRKGNVLSVSAAVFDFDNTVNVEMNGKIVKTKVATDTTVTVEKALAAFPDVCRFVYTSWSNSPDWPHLRLVLPYSRPVTEDEQERIWKTLAKKLAGLRLVCDPACKDASRLWYIPARRDDSFRSVLENGAFLDVDSVLAEVVPTDTTEPMPSVTDVGIDEVLSVADVSTSERLRRASAYLRRLPGAVSGAGGHTATFKAAIALVKGFALSPDFAFTLLKDEYNPRCEPSWSDGELRHKIEEAAKEGKTPIGSLLNPRAKGTNASPPVEKVESSKKTTLDLLIDMIAELQPFRVLTGRVFVAIGGRALPVDGPAFLHRIAHEFRGLHRKNVTKAIVENALVHVLGGSLREGQAPVRYADDGAGGIVLDLARRDGKCVQITRDGCTIKPSSTVAFYRPDGTSPMPIPLFPQDDAECAAVFETYFKAQGLEGDENAHTRVSVFAWQLSAMRPMEWGSRAQEPTGDESDDDGSLTSYSILSVQGSEGSGKTTRGKAICRSIDARTPDLMALPEKLDDLVISSENTHLLAFDNTSPFKKDVSDALCRTATGDGYKKRSLYSNRDLSVFRGSRPVMLNGIADVVREVDLLDRTLVVRLLPLPSRKLERELKSTFKAVWPRVLGALCYCVSKSIAKLDQTNEVPDEVRAIRMVDACLFASAAEEAAGFSKGSVVKAYMDSKAEATTSAGEDPIVRAILSVVTSGEEWSGTTANLLDALTAEAKGIDGKKALPKWWPSEARGLTSALRKLETTLRALGVSLTFPKGSGGGDKGKERILTVTRAMAETDRRTEPSEDWQPGVPGSDVPTVPTLGFQKSGNAGVSAAGNEPPTLTALPPLDQKMEMTVGTVGPSETLEYAAAGFRRSPDSLVSIMSHEERDAWLSDQV